MTTKLADNSSTPSRDVFISHRTADDAWAQSLAEWLELNSIKIWIDNQDIHPGESIPGAINRGLGISRHIALVMTPAYFADDAEWTTAEWEAALFSDPAGRRSRVIPLLVKNSPYIPPLLRHLSWIDFRDQNNQNRARDDLLRMLQGRPSRFAPHIAGQAITLTGHISSETLFIERASVYGKPDLIDENLASNLLPATKAPKYIWSIPIASKLGRQTDRGIAVYPRKERLKEIIREWQEIEKVEYPFTPVFTRYEDRLWTLHNPNRSNHPLTPIAANTDIKTMKVSDLLPNADERRIVSGLFMACIHRYCYRLGLRQIEKKPYFFPSMDGKDVVKRWKLKMSVPRTVTSRYESDDGTRHFFHHDALYVRAVFLGVKLYLQVEPAIAFSDDGTTETLWTGARVGPMAMNWRAREKNIDVFRDLRFWIYQLAKGNSTIRIFAGDQSLYFDTRPATVHVHSGIANDQSNVEELMERLPIARGERDFEHGEIFEVLGESDDDL